MEFQKYSVIKKEEEKERETNKQCRKNYKENTKTSVFRSRETGILGNFVGAHKGAK